MKTTNNETFDFDMWANLAKENPEQFEQKRKEAINGFITATPEKNQRRLEGLQWRIDMERNLCKDPADSAKRVFDMMWESVYGEQGLQHALKQLVDQIEPGAAKNKVAEEPAKAKVLSFS